MTKLARVNTLILVLIILINGYVIAAPFFPGLLFWWDNRGGRQAAVLRVQIHTPAKRSNANTSTTATNSVTIPSMLLDKPILEGSIASQYKTLDQGIWRWPKGSTPDHGGNTILIGHRFTYTNPRGVLYFLNKVVIGDEIGMTWGNKKYLYKVTQVEVVPPTDTAIENSTSDARLTIFTCTPLWWPKDRLVVIAELEAL